MTSGGQYSYTYNAENQITNANGVNYTGACPERSRRDGDGLRVEKSSSSSTTLYWRGLSGQVIEETGASGNMEIDYVFFDGRRIASLDSSGNVHYLFSDILGSVRVATDSSGNVCFDADYYPYGQEVDQSTSCEPEYKFAGMEYDSETGNYYDYARYYNPRIGRFMTPDPSSAGAISGNPQSWNAYSYVLNNPETLIDPTGMLYCLHNKLNDCVTDAVFNADKSRYRGFNHIYLGTSVTVNGRTNRAFLTQVNVPRDLSASKFGNFLKPQSQGPQKRGFLACTFTGKVGASLGETALDAVGIIPGENDIVHGAQMVSAVGGTAISLFGDVTGAGLSATGAGLEIARDTGTVIEEHGVEMVPVAGNAISAIATVHDASNVRKAYGSCMSGGG